MAKEQNTDYSFQTQYGFDDVTEFCKRHPGENEYACTYCGLYRASKPRCNECEDVTGD
jgi:hypothetical protein